MIRDLPLPDRAPSSRLRVMSCAGTRGGPEEHDMTLFSKQPASVAITRSAPDAGRSARRQSCAPSTASRSA